MVQLPFSTKVHKTLLIRISSNILLRQHHKVITAMAVCQSLPPPLSSTQSVLRGCRTVRLTNSTRKEFIAVDKKVSDNIKNAGCYLNYNYGCIKGGHVNRLRYNKSKNCTNTTVAKVEDYSSIDTLKTPIEQLKLFYAFTRPYACIGVIFGIASSSLIAIENLSDISLPFLIGLLKAVAAFGFLIIYVNGVNQLFDIDIDKVNKPYLPVASGEMNLSTGIAIVVATGVMAFSVAMFVGSKPLLWGIFLFFLILSAYSVDLPLLRWKNNAVGAAFSIVSGYGIVLQLATYFHMQKFVLGRQANFPRTLTFGIIAMSIFYLAVALFKDVPDIKGDDKFGVHSLATRLGQKQVFWICVYLVQMVYIFGIAAGATSSHLWSKFIIMLSHAVLSLVLWKQAKSMDLNNESAITSFYMLIWKLLYAECLLIPLVR